MCAHVLYISACIVFVQCIWHLRASFHLPPTHLNSSSETRGRIPGCLQGATPPFSPTMVWVLPLPVWPYAMMHTLYLPQWGGWKGRWGGGEKGLMPLETWGGLYPSSSDVSRGLISSNTALWPSDGENTLKEDILLSAKVRCNGAEEQLVKSIQLAHT